MAGTVNTNVPVKKTKLLEASLSLMLSKGFHATTIDEICAEAGVTKGSFFYYFKSKEDAGKATVTFFEQLQLRLIENSGVNGLQDPWENLQQYLDFFVSLASNPEAPQSCLTAIMTQELADTRNDFRELCEETLYRNALPLKVILDEVIVHNPPLVTIDSQELAEHFLSIYQGSLILAKAKQNRTVIIQNIEHFRRYMNSIFRKSEPQVT